MAGEVATIALKAGVESANNFHIPPGAAVRLKTAATSTAKAEVSFDGGHNWTTWAFGTLAQSSEEEQKFPVPVLVRATALTGTATLEIDESTGPMLIFVKGTPLNKVAAPAGTVAIRYDGGEDTVVYVKEAETDATGWSPLTDA